MSKNNLNLHHKTIYLLCCDVLWLWVFRDVNNIPEVNTLLFILILIARSVCKKIRSCFFLNIFLSVRWSKKETISKLQLKRNIPVLSGKLNFWKPQEVVRKCLFLEFNFPMSITGYNCVRYIFCWVNLAFWVCNIESNFYIELEWFYHEKNFLGIWI